MPLLDVEPGQIAEAGATSGWSGPRLVADLQRAFVEWFRVGVVALIGVQQRKVVQVGRDFGMGRAVPSARCIDRQRTLVQRFGLDVASFVPVEYREVVQAGGDHRMIRSSSFSRI